MSRQTDPDAQLDLVLLPDDVLIRILGQLDLATQLKMTNVHSRFLMVMLQIWRLQCKSITLSLIELDLGEKDLRCFLGSNQETFQVLRLKMTKQLHFDILIDYIFPNIHDFRFSTYSFRLRDKDIERIMKSFPNLRAFSPQGSFTGKHLEHFPSLEHLTLSFCSDIKLGNLVRILTTRKLKSLKLEIFDDEHFKKMKLPLEGIKDLEFLHCDTGELDGWFLMHLDQLTKLKELHVSGVINNDTVINVLNSSSRSSIWSVHLNARDLNITNLFNKIYEFKIRTLIVKNANFSFNYTLDKTDFFQNINKICLMGCAFRHKMDLYYLLEGLKTANVLVLDSCIFGFPNYTFSAQEMAKDRSTALHLYLIKNLYMDNSDNTEPMVWKMNGQHSLFKPQEIKLHFDIKPTSCPLSIRFE